MALLVFTDGAASNNGKSNVRASWSSIVGDEVFKGIVKPYSYVLNKDEKVGGCVINYDESNLVMPSNNRGELLGIINGLVNISNNIIKYKSRDIIFYSDSLICIKTINEWYHKRQKKGTLKEFKNLDLIEIMMSLITDIKNNNINITFNHINGHQKINNITSNGNNLADYHATTVLKESVNY